VWRKGGKKNVRTGWRREDSTGAEDDDLNSYVDAAVLHSTAPPQRYFDSPQHRQHIITDPHGEHHVAVPTQPP
jgi:hypothetical protein